MTKEYILTIVFNKIIYIIDQNLSDSTLYYNEQLPQKPIHYIIYGRDWKNAICKFIIQLAWYTDISGHENKTIAKNTYFTEFNHWLIGNTRYLYPNWFYVKKAATKNTYDFNRETILKSVLNDLNNHIEYYYFKLSLIEDNSNSSEIPKPTFIKTFISMLSQNDFSYLKQFV